MPTEARGPGFGPSWKDCEVALFLNVNLFVCVFVCLCAKQKRNV